MAKRQLRREDYSVGWVCALPVELAAAQLMLDEEHHHGQDPNDTNLYTLGRIGGHNVVIACLPAGQMGTNSAAVVAMQMKSAFPLIRFGLMVGIGGGVPSEEVDIRLGDVVVSQPHMGHGGVVQYDFGKTTISRFERTGFLNTPPAILLNAVSKIRANHLIGKGSFSTYLSELSRVPAFCHDDAVLDVLFEPSYEHAGEAACRSCSKERVVERQTRENREIVVHYGTIASGNQVMKDGAIRDMVSSELGGVLCFEMEAAGLMNNFPCLVIRGICDYADSHKNKKWQAYAAGTAAAYAKEVLSAIPVAEVAITPSIDETVTGKNAHWAVPFQRNPRFVGRSAEIAKVESLLSTEERCEKVAIIGLGGAGKTQIALELAYRLRAKHSDCSVFWVPAINIESLQEAYFEISRRLGIPKMKDDKVDIQDLVRHHLSQEGAGRWLLVFDNVDDIDLCVGKGDDDATKSRRLMDYLPASSHGSIVFTTRNRKIAVKLAGNNVIQVKEMDDSHAKEMLKKCLINPSVLAISSDRTTTALLERLTFLPLAIVQAAAYINENEVSISEYLELLQDTEQNVVEILSEDFEDEGRYRGTKNPVACTWLISFDQIRNNNPLATEYLSFMSCMNPKGIPKSLLPPTQSKKRAADALGTLSAYSFVIQRPAENSLDIHRLVHLATRNWLRKEDRLIEWSRKAMVRLEEVFPSDEYNNRSLWREYLPHARYVLDFGVLEKGMETEGMETEEMETEETLRWKFARCLDEDGRFAEASREFAQVVQTSTRMLGAEHPDTLISMADLALTYRNQGRLKEAEELQLQVMETNKRMLGMEHRDTLGNMNDLASTYRAQGRWKEAEEVDVQAMETSKRVLGDQNLHTLNSMANLASTYYYQGRWKETEDLQVKVVKMLETLLEPEHPNRLSSMSHLAVTYKAQGQWEKAKELFTQVVNTRKRVLGEGHPSTLGCIANLASVYWNQGQWKEGEDLQVQVVETSKRALGMEHPRTLFGMAYLAWMYRKQQRWKEAEDLQMQVVETSKSVLGTEHPRTLNGMHDLALILRRQQQNQKALALMRKCAQLRERVLGLDHPDTVSSRDTLNAWDLISGDGDRVPKRKRSLTH